MPVELPMSLEKAPFLLMALGYGVDLVLLFGPVGFRVGVVHHTHYSGVYELD